MIIDYDTFRKNLNTLIISKGYNLTKFSEQSEIPLTTISRYLSGSRTPDLEYAARIADFFGVTIDWLLGRTENQYNPLPDGASDLAKLYSIASPDDQDVIDVVLKKYQKFI